MTQTYTFLAELAQSAGLLYFMAIFISVAIYALWPSNQTKFDAASRIPLQDD